jgi:multidrug resistance efflux pump
LTEDIVRDRRTRRSGNLTFALVLALALSALGYYVWLERVEASLPDGVVVSTGILDATQVPVASAVGGEVTVVHVKQGAAVTAGTALLRVRGETGETTVTTPRAGRVEKLQVAVGARIEPGQVVAAVTDISDLRMVAPFPATERIPIGAEARLHFREFGDRPIPARVATVAQPDGGTDAAGQGRTVTVTVEVTDTRSAPLQAGLRGRVYLRLREGAPWPARIR